jgi:Flp pilus assembly pilin Flp
MKFLNFFCFDEKGGGIVEYMLIIVLIALATTAAMAAVGPKISIVMSNIDTNL